MPHVLYATLALALLGLASLGQHRSERQEQTRSIGVQLEAAAQSVAAGVHEALTTLPFDAIVTTDTTALTPEFLFGPDLPGDGFAEADDLDDVHGVVERVSRTLADPETGAPRDIPFSVSARVQYVRCSGSTLSRAGGARTFTKEVIVVVRHASLSSPLRLVRTYSP